MTGYTVHTGSTEKFSKGWDTIFKSAPKKAAAKPAAAPKAKKSGKKGKKEAALPLWNSVDKNQRSRRMRRLLRVSGQSLPGYLREPWKL